MNNEEKVEGYVWRCEYCQACSLTDGQDVKDPNIIHQAFLEDKLEDTVCAECWNRIQVGDF